MRKTAKKGGVLGLALAALLAVAKLVNAVTSEHTVANEVTDKVLDGGCAVAGVVGIEC